MSSRETGSTDLQADQNAASRQGPSSSPFLPTFLRSLAREDIHTVMLCGCGGGFDFVHSLVLYPELRRLGKEVIIGSYSFGYPREIGGEAEVVFDEAGVIAKRVTVASVPDPYYAPEVHACSFLDVWELEAAPHAIYAYYARDFTVPLLSRLYSSLIARHAIDAIVLVDGGSDSLMVGDEDGLGDPIEDAVSVATAAGLQGLKAKVLISIGLGADRFNDVSDAASLRAIAELTRLGGFLGAVANEPTNPAFAFYHDCIEHIYHHQGFRSVLAGAILAAVEGHHGSAEVPRNLEGRVGPGQLHLWPLMAMLWAFDPEVVARRSLIAQWVRECETVQACYDAFFEGRDRLGTLIRPVENWPRHEDARG